MAVEDRAVEVHPIERDLSKRETIAAMAMQAILTARSTKTIGDAAHEAVMCADALIEELSIKPTIEPEFNGRYY